MNAVAVILCVVYLKGFWAFALHYFPMVSHSAHVGSITKTTLSPYGITRNFVCTYDTLSHTEIFAIIEILQWPWKLAKLDHLQSPSYQFFECTKHLKTSPVSVLHVKNWKAFTQQHGKFFMWLSCAVEKSETGHHTATYSTTGAVSLKSQVWQSFIS